MLWNRQADKRGRIQDHVRVATPRGSLADIEKTTIAIFNAAAPSVVYIRMLQTFEIGQSIRLNVRRGDRVRPVTVTIMDIS